MEHLPSKSNTCCGREPLVAGASCAGRVALALAGTMCLLSGGLVGCEQEPVVRRYRVLRKEALPLAKEAAAERAAPQRTLGAIVPREQYLWFLKLSGPQAAVEAQQSAFLALVRSLRFEGGEPKWTLPEGWRDEGGGGIRFRTLRVPGQGDRSLECSITRLPRPAGPVEQAVLMNVNRWRKQLGLSPLTPDRFTPSDAPDAELSRTQLADGTPVYLVNIVGVRPAEGTPSGVELPQGHPPIGAPAPDASGRPAAVPIAYERPGHWQPKPPGAFAVVAFVANGEDGAVSISVSRLGGSAGGLVANVNRWRSQVGLPAADEATILKAVKTKQVAGATAKIVELKGPQNAILAAIVPRGGETWFIKAMGPKPAVERERVAFDRFVGSLQFKDGAASSQ